MNVASTRRRMGSRASPGLYLPGPRLTEFATVLVHLERADPKDSYGSWWNRTAQHPGRTRLKVDVLDHPHPEVLAVLPRKAAEQVGVCGCLDDGHPRTVQVVLGAGDRL